MNSAGERGSVLARFVSLSVVSALPPAPAPTGLERGRASWQYSPLDISWLRGLKGEVKLNASR